MPGLYGRGEFDLAGFAVGAVERGALLPRTDDLIAEGDIVLGLAASGVHANGFSLVRLVLREQGLEVADPCPWEPSRNVGEALLTPTRIYVAAASRRSPAGGVKALAHITGGGLVENPPRVLADGQVLQLRARCMASCPPEFAWLARAGRLERQDLLRTFNCGIGMILVVDPARIAAVCRRARGALARRCMRSAEIGCRLRPRRRSSSSGWKRMARRRVAVLISGGGSNLQALLDATAAPAPSASHRARGQQRAGAHSGSSAPGVPASPTR